MQIYIFIKEPQANVQDKGHDYDIRAQGVMNEINKIGNCKTVVHTNSSNVVFVDADWVGKQISQNLQSVKGIQDVANYIVYYDPLVELQNATKEHDFYKAFSLGCALFEAYGAKILNKYFDNSSVHVAIEKMERLNLQTLIIMLFTQKIIDEKPYNEMTKINKIRNTLVIHHDPTNRLTEELLKDTSEHIEEIFPLVQKLSAIYSSL